MFLDNKKEHIKLNNNLYPEYDLSKNNASASSRNSKIGLVYWETSPAIRVTYNFPSRRACCQSGVANSLP